MKKFKMGIFIFGFCLTQNLFADITYIKEGQEEKTLKALCKKLEAPKPRTLTKEEIDVLDISYTGMRPTDYWPQVEWFSREFKERCKDKPALKKHYMSRREFYRTTERAGKLDPKVIESLIKSESHPADQ